MRLSTAGLSNIPTHSGPKYGGSVESSLSSGQGANRGMMWSLVSSEWHRPKRSGARAGSPEHG